jgi:hypothetical protein
MMLNVLPLAMAEACAWTCWSAVALALEAAAAASVALLAADWAFACDACCAHPFAAPMPEMLIAMFDLRLSPDTRTAGGSID